MFGFFLGLVFGFVVPAGALLVQMYYLDWQVDADWIYQEIRHDPFFYAYMGLVSPLLFAFFGLILGWLTDKIVAQKRFLAELNRKLGHESITDDLTGVYNHRYILYELERELGRAKRYRRIFSLIMMDVDDFKAINDNYGHIMGDNVLRELASLLRRNVRRVDTVGRYGGDEFIVILPETPLSGAGFAAQRLQIEVQRGMKRAGYEKLGVTISVGLSTSGGLKEFDKMALIHKADTALLEAKGLGKNKIVFADKFT